MTYQVYEFTEFITKDGLSYRFDSEDRCILSEEGYGMPPMEYITQRGPQQHGETLIDFRTGKRTVQIIQRQDTCSRFDYWLARSKLLNYMRPNRRDSLGNFDGILRKRLPDGTARDLRVVIEQGPSFSSGNSRGWDGWGYTETLRFIAHDPIFWSSEERTYTWALSVVNHLVFPITFPIMFASSVINDTVNVPYTGTWQTFPTITITGPLHGLTLENLATGKKIVLTYSISLGETVYIYLDYGNKRVVNNVGTILTGCVDEVNSNFIDFAIVPEPEATSGLNILSATGSNAIVGTTEIDVSFYDRYIGI